MESNRALRMWQLTTILLVLCNIGLILMLWLRSGTGAMPAGAGQPRHGGPRDYLVKVLHLTEDQVQQYNGMIHEHRRNMGRLRQEGLQYRKALFGLLATGAPQSGRDSLAQLIANTQKEIEVVTFDHFAAFRNILTPEQQQEFDKNTEYVMQQMQHGRPPGPNGERMGPPEGEGPMSPPGEGMRRPGPPGDDGPDGPPPHPADDGR